MPKKKIKIIDTYTSSDEGELQEPLFYWNPDTDTHTRVVWNFDEETRRKQHIALRALRSISIPNAVATAQPGKTLIDNINPHLHREISRVSNHNGMPKKWFVTDFVDAFGSVQQDVMSDKVDRIIRRYGKGREHFEARRIIGQYIDDGAFLPGVEGLPQGSATSGDLLNWYMLDADTALANMFILSRGYRNVVATRYLDDLTISSIFDDDFGRRFRKRVLNIYREHAPGMEPATGKTHVWHLDDEHPVVTITGLSVYQDGRVTPSRELLTKTREVMGEISLRLASGDSVTSHDLALVAGYNGVLHLAGDATHSGSKLVRGMAAEARYLLDVLPARVE